MRTVQDPEFQKAAAVAGMEVGLGTADDFYATTRLFDELSPQTEQWVKQLAGM